MYLIKTNANGDSLWTQTSDGGYIVCATVFTVSGFNASLIKIDSNGNITSTFNIPTPNPNRKIEAIVDVLGKETQAKSNTPFIEIYDDGTVEKKLIIE